MKTEAAITTPRAVAVSRLAIAGIRQGEGGNLLLGLT
jgi:hypothetical protein